LVDSSSIVTKTQGYLDVFSRFKTQETAQAVERILLQQKDLTSFERAQLGRLFGVWGLGWRALME
jgi:DNA-directed RNA polymerase II subunit RPB4